VLNLRADYATSDSIVLERKLTLLLESRLTSIPEFVVLERRHAWSLGFERSLLTVSPPLLQGAYVVDGTLDLPPQNQGKGDITIHLRLRSLSNQPTPFEIHGTFADLSGLVEKMTAEIEKTCGVMAAATTPWQPEKEAREYLKEGIWGWQNHADDPALEALDSAELLGEKAPDLVPIRIGVLLDIATRSLEIIEKNSSDQAPKNIPPADPIINDTLRAISEAARYDSEKMQARLQLLSWRHNPDLRTDQIQENLSNFTSHFLVYLDAHHSPRADELRQLLRTITGYDPLHGKLGRADMSNPQNVMTYSMDEWDLTLEEELADLHLLATMPHQFIPLELLKGQGTGFCKRFLKTQEEQKRAFDEFVESLRSDPKAQLTYQLTLSCSFDEKIADAAYTAYWKEMWKQREELVTQKVQVEEWTSSRPVPEERRRKHAGEMLPLLHYYLTHVNNYRDWEYSWDVLWQPDEWSKEDAAAIWPEFLDFKKRAEADYLARGHSHLKLDELEAPFQKKFPEIAQVQITVQPEPLIVNRLWHPWLAPESPTGPNLDAYVYPVVANDELWAGVWFASQGGDKHILCEVNPSNFKTTGYDYPKEFSNGGAITATPKAVFLYNNSAGNPPSIKPNYIARFDFKTRTWEVRPCDYSWLPCYAVDNSLYFDLSNGAQQLSSGIERYDWDTAKYTLLASARRKPAQNQFDDNGGYMIQSIFAGPGGKPCVATLENGTYYIQDQPGKWVPVFDSSRWTWANPRQEKTLVYNPDGEMVLLDPARIEPEYLMNPGYTRFRKAAMAKPGEHPKTPWPDEGKWDAVPLGFGELIGGNSDHLFRVVISGDDKWNYKLHWFDRKHGRKGHIIPLKFVLDEKTFASLPPLYQSGTEARFSRESMESPGKGCNPSIAAVREGICLCSDDLGIWLIPYHEIESYLDNHVAEELVAPAAPVGPLIKIPPPEDDVQSRVIGDMVDPGSPYISFR
jgi:hypothetical protein